MTDIPKCRNCGEYADDCPDECENDPTECGDHDFITPQESAPLTLTVTYPDCGHSVSVMTGMVLPANCPACAIGIPEGMTRCEDYPCCGHTDGDGCIPRPEHTSAYWQQLDSRLRESGMDDRDIDEYYDRMDMMREFGY